MKLTGQHGIALLSALVTLLATGGADGVSAKAEVRIAVIVSQDAPPYQEALEGFKTFLMSQGANPQWDVRELHGDGALAAEALQRALQDRPALVLALGSLGAQSAVREVRDIPIVAGLVLRAEDTAKAPNAAAVVLEFPVETELKFLQRLLPGQQNIGVLFNPSENQARIDAAARAAVSLGLTLHARKVESPKDIPDALESLNKKADVLGGVAEQVVLNPQTVRPILLFSLRNRIPFVGLSATWVKAGALYALDRDYNDIGQQCGEVALKILQGATPSSMAPVTPRKVMYSVNLKTARLLKLDIRAPVLQAAQAVIE
jgi:putative tryptophan/tyrosine transport system substrate-binding protein